MKKKIIGLIVGISVVAALLGTGTLAFFTDTETTAENTFTAGVIDIDVTEDSTVIISGDVTDLKPCMTGYKIIRITATGVSNPMELWKKINTPTRYENTVVEPEDAYYEANDIDDPPGKNDIDRYIHFDCWIEKNEEDPDPSTVTKTVEDVGVIPESEGWLLSENTDDFSGFVPSVIAASNNGVVGKYFYLGTIEPGETMIIVQSFHMDQTVGNWAQSDSIAFTEEIVAQQIEGSTLPPAPGTVLNGHGRTDPFPTTWP